MKFALFLVAYLCIVNKLNSAPLLGESDGFCSGHDTLKYETGQEYRYDYNTKTQLWINDVSEESKTTAELRATVVLRQTSPCTLTLRLEGASLTGESVGTRVDLRDLALPVLFKLNSKGELHPTVGFKQADKPWSRNVKRGILSALQTKSVNDLRQLDRSEGKSAVVYETDVLGRCRTTYSLKESGSSVKLEKTKALHGCTLNGNRKSSAVQFTTYRNMPEFYQGRLFIETYECESEIKNNVVAQVECKEYSTYKISSRGQKGVQAIVKQSLKFTGSSASGASNDDGNYVNVPINFEFADKSTNEQEDFDANQFLNDLCSRVQNKNGLDNQHSNNFRNLVNQLESQSTESLVKLYQDSSRKCKQAGLTVAQAIVLANTENSFKAALNLVDDNQLADQVLISEYPLLTALARNKQPSAEFLQYFSNYLQSKPVDFPYLRKLYLVYSALAKTHCQNVNCDSAKLNQLSSLFAKNLGSNCADSSNKDLVVTSLKAIGNIGSFENTNVLNACAENKQNSLEVRVSAIQAFRRFSCDNLAAQASGLRNILRNTEEDTELRINAFQIGVRCADNEKFQEIITTQLPKLLENESNIQFLTYVVDYAKEHGLTVLLNPILNNPKLREKFSVNFKELSWNNFKYTYSLARDGAIELDTSVIFASDRSFIPRSIRVNATIHLFGLSVNFIDSTLRLEGMDSILKSVILDKLSNENVVKKYLDAPEQLFDLLNGIADKLKYSEDKPYASLSLKLYGAEVFFSELNSRERLLKFANFLRNPRESLLYAQVNTIKNLFLIDSNVRQPLANGFEFNTFMDVSAGLLIVKESKKTDEGETRKFEINNLHGVSLAINRRFEVQLSDDSKLALKKKAFLNARLRLDVTGTKKPGQAEYKLNLTPGQDLPLLVIDGKFYKLTSNNQYKEVNQFTVEQVKYQNCTSERFRSAFGVDLCLSFNRPKLGGNLFELLKPVDLDRVLANDNDDGDDHEDHDHDDDDDEDDDHDHDSHEDDNSEEKIYGNLRRPKVSLSGPYHYHVSLKNPNAVKSLILRAELERKEDETKDVHFHATVSSVSQSGDEKNGLELHYTRSRGETNRAFNRLFNLELRVPSTSEVRFKATGEVAYRKQEHLRFKFELENKILKDFHFLFNVERERKNENDVVPFYQVEALLDSKLRSNKHYRLFFDVEPEGKNIKSDLIFEYHNPSTNNQVVKVVDAILTLTSLSDSPADYSVDLQVETVRPSKLHVYGNLQASLFQSNIELSADYEGPRVNFNEASIKLAHSLDLSGAGKSSFEIGAKLPTKSIEINHGLKVLVEADVTKLQLNSIEVQLRTPRSQVVNDVVLPFTVYVSRQVSESGSERVFEFSAGLNNFNTDLSARAESSKVANALVNIDKNPVLNSLAIRFTRTTNSNDNSRRSVLNVKKNEVTFANLDGSVFFNMKDTEHRVGGSLGVKVKDYSGSLQTKLSFNDNKNGQLSYNFELNTESLIRILLKIVSVNSQLQLDHKTNKVDFKFDIMKLGETKSLKLASTSSALRTGTAGPNGVAPREFDVSYEKVFANGDIKTGNGVVKLLHVAGKKYEAVLDVKDRLTSKLSLKLDKQDGESQSEVELRYTHLDESVKSERHFRVAFGNKDEAGSRKTSTLNFLAKKGEQAKFDNIDSLTYLIDINTKNTHLVNKDQRIRVNGENSVMLKVQSIKLDWKSNHNNDLKSKLTTTNVDLNARFPAMFSDPGKQNQVVQKFTYENNASKQKRTLTYALDSDNKILNRYFKKLNLDYVREAVDNQNSLNLNVKLEKVEGGVKTMNVKVERKNCETLTGKASSDDSDESNEVTDAIQVCQGGRVVIKQDIVPTWESRFAAGKTLDLTNCEIETKLVRQKTANYLLDVLGSVTCKNVKLFRDSLLVSRDISNDQPKFTFRLETLSDLYYEPKLLEFIHKKFRAASGQLELSIKNEGREFTQRLSYERNLDEVTGKLVKGAYRLSSVKADAKGDRYEKSCEMNIEAKTNYYNKLDCSLQTPTLPAKTTYGYSLKANNYKELIFGKRDLDLEINLPTGRTLKVEYKGTRATALDASFDEDDDNNNDREFNSQAKLYWDFSRQPDRFLIVNAKRDNYANTNSKLTVEILRLTGVKAVVLTLDRKRAANETDITFSAQYELDSGNKNQLDLAFRMASDLDSNLLSAELNLQRPAFNVLYQNRFNKLNGRLQYLNLRLGRLLQFSVQKDDPENRKILVQLANPNEALYRVESNVLPGFSRHHTVESKLLDKSNNVLATLTSTFDSNNNNLDVKVDAVKSKQNYRLNVGVYNESFANGYLLRNENTRLGVATLGVVSHEDHSDLILTLRWNRVWGQFKEDVLGNGDVSPSESDKFNSYFGDVYAQLQDELKPIVDRVRAERTAVQQDVAGSFYLIVDYYKYYLPQGLKSRLEELVKARQEARQQEEENLKNLPLYKRFFTKYNQLSDRLKDLHFRVRKYSQRLAKYVPRLPRVNYNNEVQLNKMAPEFDNNLIVSRPTYNSYTLYQFNAEYRERLRSLANTLLRLKGNLLRNTNGYSLRALYNKYKLRPLREYTVVGSVYNRRNVIAFNGELKVLKTKCRYLLAHELSKNQFSVVLNNNDQSGVITVSAYGQEPIDIGYTGAFVRNQAVNLPYRVELKDKDAVITVRRTHNGVTLQVNNDLQVACSEDSKSCTVALTRWYTGKLNGLLGKSNHDLANVEEDYWYLDSACKLSNQVLKKPTEEAVKTCYTVFGKHRRAQFRDAFLAVRPNGWQRLCETVLTADANAKCALMRAFVNHARLRSVEVNEPNECFQCSANNQNFYVNKNVQAQSSSLVSNAVDYAFVFMPCDKKTFSDEVLNVFKRAVSLNANNRYYFVKVSQHGASVYQDKNGQNSNFDMQEAMKTIAEASNSNEVHKTHFYHGLFLAANLFSDRIAQQRKLIIVSCGNCLAYTPLASVKLARLLNGRNIAVSSYNTHEIKDLDSSDNQVVGYGGENVFLYNEDDKQVETDNLESYKLEHRGDLCQRLAEKTNGFSFNLNLINKSGVFAQTLAKYNEATPKYTHTVKQCVRLDTPFGDFEDFTYEQNEVQEDKE